MERFKNSKLSVITPVYNNENTIEELFHQVSSIATKHFSELEYLFVNDASPDNSRNVLSKMAQNNPEVKVINFVRNFGQHTALMVGMEYATGDYIYFIDGDLEEPPCSLPDFLAKMKEGYEIVVGSRTTQRGFFKHYSAKLFTLVYNWLSDYKVIGDTTNMRLMTKNYVQYLLQFKEKPFIGGFTSWIGMPIGLINIPWQDRQRHSSYTLAKLFSHARIGLIGFSTKIMRIAFFLGVAVSILSFLYTFALIVNYLLHDNVPAGFTSIAMLISFFSGLQLIFIGILGEYISEIFLSTKARPKYLIYDTFNVATEKSNQS